MDHSPLGKLAAEVRNYIYELALIQSEPFHIVVANTSPPHDVRLTRSQAVDKPTSLLAVCRQTREECSQLFFANNHFLLSMPRSIPPNPPRECTLLQPLTTAIGSANFASLRRLTVELSGFFDRHGPMHRTYPFMEVQLSQLDRFAASNRGMKIECLLHISIFRKGKKATARLDMTNWPGSRDRAIMELGPYDTTASILRPGESTREAINRGELLRIIQDCNGIAQPT